MKTIMLGLDDEHKPVKAIVDDEDYEWLNSYCWYYAKVSRARNLYYAKRNLTKDELGEAYVRNKRGIGSDAFMHHIIVGIPLHDFVVDHINRNSLDNSRANLRIVTRRKNGNNTHRSRNNIYPHDNSYVFSMQLPTLALAKRIREYALQQVEEHENNQNRYHSTIRPKDTVGKGSNL